MPSKSCSKCNKRKSTDEFYKKGIYYRSECKECSKTGSRKTCIKCGKTKSRGQFYPYTNQCKLCKREYNKKSRTIECDICGKSMYKSNGYTVCYQCRKPADWMFVACNDTCKFYVSCKKRVFMTDEEHRSWMPYCFVSSPYHAAYKKEYENSHRQAEVYA